MNLERLKYLNITMKNRAKSSINYGLSLKTALELAVTNIVTNAVNNTSKEQSGISDSVQRRFVLGKVVGINSSDDDNFIYSVELSPEGTVVAIPGKSTGIAEIPDVESLVEVGYDSNNDPFILKFYYAAEVQVKAPIVYLNSDVNDEDSYGGLIMIAELTEKLNKLIVEFNNHVHSGVVTAVSGGSGAPAVGTTGESGVPTSNATDFDKADYENDTVKHGRVVMGHGYGSATQ